MADIPDARKPAEERLAGITPNNSARPCLQGTEAMIVSGHYLSSIAGWRILEAGGNAVDAGVAVGLVTNVVESSFTGIGGVAPCLLYLADRDEVVAISGVGTLPEAATLEYFRDNHAGVVSGIHATTVPAAMDAWLTALEDFGTMSFADVARDAIAAARDGFAMYPFFNKIIQVGETRNRTLPGIAAVYLPGGRVPAVGEIFVQRDLGATLQYLVDESRRADGRVAGLRAARHAFYRGDVARRIAEYQAHNGGLLTMADMADFRVGIEAPSRVSYRGSEVFAGGPYSQGPSMLQALKILEHFDLASLGHNSSAYIHVLTEAIKLVAADRDAYIGDPKFVNVPLQGLLSAEFGAERAREISFDRSHPDVPPPGRVAGASWPTDRDRRAGQQASASGGADASAFGTSYFAVIDRWGNVFSATPSDGAANGLHGDIIPGLGFIPSTRGVSSWADPSHPSSVAPRKRPRLTMGPALAIRPGASMLAFGSPGTDVQLQAMLQILFSLEIFGTDPQVAVELPRFATYSFPGSMTPHANYPGRLNLERSIGQGVADELAALGHRIEWWPDGEWLAGSMGVVRRDLGTGVVSGAADPRRTAYAVGR